MTFSEIKAGDIQLQNELLLIALWTPDDEADHSPEVLFRTNEVAESGYAQMVREN